jgi:hypothetical protein
MSKLLARWGLLGQLATRGVKLNGLAMRDGPSVFASIRFLWN